MALLLGLVGPRLSGSVPMPGPPVRVTNIGAGGDWYPVVAAHGEKMILLRHSSIALAWNVSLNGGSTWKDMGYLRYGEGTNFASQAICTDDAGGFYVVTRRNLSYSEGNGITIALMRGSFQDTTMTWELPGTNIIPIRSYAYQPGPDFLQILCDSQAGYLYLAYAEIVRDNATNLHTGEIKFIRSADGGASWSAPAELGGTYCRDLRAALGPDGEIYLVWVDVTARQIVGRKSVDQGASFGPTFAVGPRVNNRFWPIGWTGDDHGFIGSTVASAEYGPLGLSLAVDRSASATRGRVYVAWHEMAEGTIIPITGGGGEVEPNGTPAEATPIQIGRGFSGSQEGIHGVSGDCDWFRFEGTAGTMIALIGSACGVTPGGHVIDNRGVPLQCGADNILMHMNAAEFHCTEERPPLIYALPTTGRYFLNLGCSDASMSYSGSVREFRPSPTSVARDHRDIVLSWSADGGTTWSPKVRANDDPPGYDNAMPALAVDQAGRMHLMWYDRRDTPHECEGTVHTYWTYSDDGGVTRAPSVRLSAIAIDLRLIWAARGGDYLSNVNPWDVGDGVALTAIGDRVYAFWGQSDALAKQSADIFESIIGDEGTTATLVLGFGGEARSDRVRLWWRVRDPRSATGFRMHRAVGASETFQPLSDGRLIPTGASEEYELIDTAVAPSGRYRYRLEVVTREGSLWQGPIEVELGGITPRLAWQSGHPNPFSDTIALELIVPASAQGSVTIYDVAGHQVRRLHRGRFPAGTMVLQWDGLDRRGRRAPAGVYLVRAAIGNATETRSIVRID